METLLRWAGSKRQLLSKLRFYWTGGSTRYIEPFCGSACLFFNLEPTRAILGDLNADLISSYHALRNDPEQVYDCLETLPTDVQTYYQIRSIDSDGLTDIEKAARFLYLNRHCFNGIYRTNKSGQFNVPRGLNTKSTPLDYELVLQAANLLARAELINGDFSITLGKVDEGDFVYLDPPYAVAGRKIFSEYHPDAFSIEDLARLAEHLQLIHTKGAAFVISYADSKEARNLLSSWRTKRVRTRRHVAGFAGNRRSAYELIATNIEEASYAE